MTEEHVAARYAADAARAGRLAETNAMAVRRVQELVAIGAVVPLGREPGELAVRGFRFDRRGKVDRILWARRCPGCRNGIRDCERCEEKVGCLRCGGTGFLPGDGEVTDLLGFPLPEGVRS